MMFDNFDPYYFNPHHTIYASWHRMLPHLELRPIGWQSVPTTGSALWRSWRNGHATWYGYARAEAEAHAPHLARQLAAVSKPFDILCHSLGCYLALLSLRQPEPPVPRRLIMMNAAVYQSDARDLLAPFRVLEGYNIVTRDDDLLSLSARADWQRQSDIIGKSGVRYPEARQATNIVLRVRSHGRRASFDMTNPNRLFNHLYVYEAPEAAALVRALVASPTIVSSRDELPEEVRDAVDDIYPF